MRLDLLTSDWHRLVKPVLPHAHTDKDSLSLQAVRLELGPQALYAVATDRSTLAAERFPLPRDSRHGGWPPVTQLYLDDPSRDRGALPWAAELLPDGITPDGEKLDGDG